MSQEKVTMRLRLFGVPPITLCLHGMKVQSRVVICIDTAPLIVQQRQNILFHTAESKLILTEYAFDDVVQEESNWSSRVAAGQQSRIETFGLELEKSDESTRSVASKC